MSIFEVEISGTCTFIGAQRSDDPTLAHMRARFERRDPGVPDDLLAWRVVDGTEVELARARRGPSDLDRPPRGPSWRWRTATFGGGG